MPEQITPPDVESVDLQQLSLAALQDPDDATALSLVNQTFTQFETYRTNNHDNRWNEHDQLYAGWLPVRYWPGTKIPRSNVSYPLVFDQVESALPQIMSALFNNGSDWFEVVAEPGTQPQEARAIRDSLCYCFENPKDDFGGTIRNEIYLAVKQLLLHGNGAINVFFDPAKNKEMVEWVDARDLYFDPGSPTPAVESGRAYIQRKKMTVNEIKALKGDTRFKVPPDGMLFSMAMNSNFRPADSTKSEAEGVRHVDYHPGSSDWVPHPGDAKVEILIYTSSDRIIWVINGQWTLYNGANPYGVIMLCTAPCYTYLGRFYAMSIADMQSGNQRVIEGLINAHRDQLALAIHPPRVSPRGALTTPNEARFGPGVDFKVDDPSKDVAMLYPQGGLVNIYPDVQFYQTTADARTGVTGLGSGVPRPGNANRTLGGMQMQAGGSANRLSSIVQNIEDYMIVPMLYKLHILKKFHTHPSQSVPATDQQSGQNYQVPGATMGKKVQFKMQAASRMLSKDRLMNIIPMLSQTMMQGPFLEQIHRTGMTFDMPEFWEMIQEATGVKGRYQLVRPMNPQEQQMVQQTSPSVVEAQKAQGEQQNKMQIEQLKSQTELQKAQIAKQSNPQEVQMELQMKQQEMELKKQESEAKIFAEMVMNKIKAEAAREKARMDIEVKRVQTQQKAQDTMIQAQASQQAGAMNVQTQAMTHQMKMQQMIEQAKTQRQASQIAPKKPAAQSKGGVGPTKPQGSGDPGKKEKTKK